MPHKRQLLLVDDETDFHEVAKKFLVSDYDVLSAHDANEGIALAKEHRPSVVVLDLLLPGKDGVSVCRELRQNPATSSIPVVVLSCLKDPEDKIRALEAGADDYVTKPFHPGELIARLHAQLRKVAPPVSTDRLVCGDLTMDIRAKTATVGDRVVRFSLTEFEVLASLAENAGSLVSRTTIVERVNRAEPLLSSERSLDQYLQSIRRKLDGSQIQIRSIYSRGYVLQLNSKLVRK